MAAAAGGAGSACAACKYQRRRCTPECQLAEFFPQDRPRVFRNAHRLFGVSNILKTLARVGPERRREAMGAMVYEANAWEAYPAHGCVHIIHELDHQFRQTQLQLDQVKRAIQAYRDVLGDLTTNGDLTATNGDQQQLIMSCDDSLPVHHQATWMQPGGQMISSNNNNGMDDMAAANAVSQPPQYDHNSTYDDISYYFVDNMDDQMPPPHRSR